MLYHYMMHDISFVSCIENTKGLGKYEVLFVRHKEDQDRNMEKELRRYVKEQTGDNYTVSFVNKWDNNLPSDINSYKTLAQINSEKQQKQEEDLANHPLVKSIIEEHNDGYIKQIKT